MAESAVELEDRDQLTTVSSAVSDEQLIAMLVDRARSDGLQLAVDVVVLNRVTTGRPCRRRRGSPGRAAA
jgi:hypothetical protein